MKVVVMLGEVIFGLMISNYIKQQIQILMLPHM